MDQPEHVEAVNAIVAKLDAEELAEKSNALTGGCLRADDATKVITMVALAAMRTPGKEVLVAGFGGVFFACELKLFFGADIARTEIPTEEEL